jgi:hypothetical protein
MYARYPTTVIGSTWGNMPKSKQREWSKLACDNFRQELQGTRAQMEQYLDHHKHNGAPTHEPGAKSTLQPTRRPATARAKKKKKKKACHAKHAHPRSLVNALFEGERKRHKISLYLGAAGRAELRFTDTGWGGGHLQARDATRSFTCAGPTSLGWRLVCELGSHALRFDARGCPVLLAHEAFRDLARETKGEAGAAALFDRRHKRFAVPLQKLKHKLHALPLSDISAALPVVRQAAGAAPPAAVGSLKVGSAASQAAREECPHWRAMGCLLDVAERTCLGAGKRPHFILPNAKESAWLCCCPEAYKPCAPAVWKRNAACVSALRKQLGPAVEDWRELKGVPSMHRAREAVQLAREQLQRDNPKCTDVLAPARPLAGCSGSRLSRADLFCETITYQWTNFGDGDAQEFRKHQCAIPRTKQSDQALRKARHGGIGDNKYFPPGSRDVDIEQVARVRASYSNIFSSNMW